MAKTKKNSRAILYDSKLINNKIFKLLKEADIKLLENNISQLEYKRRENIIKQGTHISSLYFINEGLAKMYIESSNGKKIIIKILVPGDFIGFTDLFSEKYYHASIVALSPMKVQFFDLDIFKQIILRNAKLANELLLWQSKSNEFWLNRISSLGTKQMHGRLADSILYLSQKEFITNNIFDYLSRTDLAELTGMSKENAIRLLSEFKNDGIVSINGKKIKIHNPLLLERLSLIG